MDHYLPPLAEGLPSAADPVRSFEGMHSVCPTVHKVFEQLQNLALSDAPVLIQGELRPADFAGLLYAVAAPAHVEIPIGTSLTEAEQQLILQTLAAHGCIKQSIAEALGISRRTLYEKLALYRKQGTYVLPHRGARALFASPEPRQETGQSANASLAPTEQTTPLPTSAAEGLEPGP